MRQIKLLCASIAFVICTLPSFAQLVDDYGFKKNIDKLDFSSMPDFVKWSTPEENTQFYRCPAESFNIFCDFQRTHNVASVYSDSYFFSKYSIPKTNDLLIGVCHIDGEYWSSELLLVDKSDYSIRNSLYVAHESSAGASMQHTVRQGGKGLIVTVYTFIPKSSKSVDIVDFRFTPNATIRGKIRKEEYEVVSDFKLISTELSPDVVIKSSDFANKVQLWELYDQAVSNGSNPTPPREER